MTIRPAASWIALALVAAPLALILDPLALGAQQPAAKPRPEDTEVWKPEPKLVTPGATTGAAPSDAIILFDGRNLDEWVSSRDQSPAGWTVADGVITVNKKAGNIETRRRFKNYQLHIEWRIPPDIDGQGQSRGNSGLFLASTGAGDAGYELQILDSYENKTYVNGQAGSIYKQYAPLVNANLPAERWQTYDIIYTAPRFAADGSVSSPARLTVLHNGVLVQNNAELKGGTTYIGAPSYRVHGDLPLRLQDHSHEVRFRNIWLRKL
jgi:hypothetical protein